MRYVIIIIVIILAAYSWLWFKSQKNYPVEYGISFNQNHALDLGLNWKEVYNDMLAELKPKYVRVAAMWSEVEKNKGEYDFASVDYLMEAARKNNAKVIMVVGQKAPRWPECHVPEWLAEQNGGNARDYLMSYISATVERYKNNSALEFWQVENEPFIGFRFGNCKDFKEEYVLAEIDLVRQLDSAHPIILTDSGELSTWRRAIKNSDYFGATLYRVVRKPNGRVFTYDWLPPAFYRYKAKVWGQDLSKMFISELQAEPWFESSSPADTPLEIQEQTMNPERLREHFDYVEKIGVPRAYLWGVEWWYWIKEVRNDSRYWDIVKTRLTSET